MRRGKRNNNRRRERGPQHKINEMIRFPEVRVTGTHPETEEKFPGEVMSTRDAQFLARDLGVDMILISEKANPPVVQLADYKKFLYDQKKRKKEQEQNQKKTEVKELRLGPNTDDHDLNFKTNHAINWLDNGDKVKAVVFFRGRTIVHKDRGELILMKLAEALKEHGIPENMPKMEGKRMYMFFKPKGK